MGLTTTRFGSSISRDRNGVNSGGGALPSESSGAPTSSRYHSVTCATSSGSRSARLSYVMRLLRVIRLKLNCSGCWRT
jgi:hypothetical protein